MSDYTPGEWLACESSREVRDANDELIADVDGNTDTEAVANTRLIAASPDLLAMLKRVRETCHMSEDPELGDDIDRLIGKALGQPYKELNDLLDYLEGDDDGKDG